MKMKIRKGDTVIVRSGKDKGKKGKVLRAFPALNKVLVEGINNKKVHEKTRKQGQKGQIIERSHPIWVSAVALIDPADGKATRVRLSKSDGKVTRIAVRSDKTI